MGLLGTLLFGILFGGSAIKQEIETASSIKPYCKYGEYTVMRDIHGKETINGIPIEKEPLSYVTGDPKCGHYRIVGHKSHPFSPTETIVFYDSWEEKLKKEKEEAKKQVAKNKADDIPVYLGYWDNPKLQARSDRPVKEIGTNRIVVGLIIDEDGFITLYYATKNQMDEDVYFPSDIIDASMPNYRPPFNKTNGKQISIETYLKILKVTNDYYAAFKKVDRLNWKKYKNNYDIYLLKAANLDGIKNDSAGLMYRRLLHHFIVNDLKNEICDKLKEKLMSTFTELGSQSKIEQISNMSNSDLLEYAEKYYFDELYKVVIEKADEILARDDCKKLLNAYSKGSIINLEKDYNLIDMYSVPETPSNSYCNNETLDILDMLRDLYR